MAETYPTVSDREQETQQKANLAGVPDSATPETPVGIYERPARSRPSIMGMVLLLLVLVIVAYFLLQWLR